MRSAIVGAFVAIALWSLCSSVRAENGIYFCGSGTFRNQPTCSPTACTGTLIPTCTAPEGSSSGSATLSFVQGICDDLGPIPCGGKFKAFFEGCGGIHTTNNGLGTTRVSGIYRLCYDPSGGGQCTGTGSEILRGPEHWETYSIGTAPLTAQGDHSVTVTKTFTFNGKKRKLVLAHGFSNTVAENGPCNTTDCGFGGCFYKTR